MTRVDSSYPIILGHDGRVMDGMHRIARALLEGRAEIAAIHFRSPLEPDYQTACRTNCPTSERVAKRREASAVAYDERSAASPVHSAFYGKIADEAAFFGQMIEARRLVVRLRVNRLYGVLLEKPPGTLTCLARRGRRSRRPSGDSVGVCCDSLHPVDTAPIAREESCHGRTY